MLKTSEDWQKKLNEIGIKITMLDPDGWDRQDFEYSWFKELISLKEFRNRYAHSTVLLDNNSNFNNLGDIINSDCENFLTDCGKKTKLGKCRKNCNSRIPLL